LLVPFLNPVWFHYMSHKVGRLIVPWALAAAFVSSSVLAVDSWFFACALAAQGLFYGLALVGAWLEREVGDRAGGVDMAAARGQGAVR
jgi:hypothetical protein